MFKKINFLKKEIRALIVFSIFSLIFVFYSEYREYNTTRSYNKNAPESLKNQVYLSDLALFANRKLAKSFTKTISLNYHNKPSSVVYGNKVIGHYRTQSYKLQNKKLTIELIPPGFKDPINFYIDGVLKASKIFEPNPSNILKNIKVQRKGVMAQNFFLLGGVFFPNKLQSKKRGYFALILNRVGEIVWAHIPKQGKQNIRKYPVIKQISKGKYAILFGEKWSYFEMFNHKGEISFQLEPEKLPDPFVIHHDFYLTNNNRQLITFGHELGFINPYFLKTPWDDFSRILSSPLAILATPIIEVDIIERKAKKLFSPFKRLQTLEGNKLLYTKGFLEAILKSEPRHFTKWKQVNAKIDWLHANSIQYTNQGFLCSFRNTNKVIMFSHSFDKILWTLGRDPTDTYYIKNPHKQFFHQHHVSLLNDGRVMMLDNHTGPDQKHKRGTRVVIYQLDPIIGTATISWEYTATHFLKIGNRGSVEKLKNGNILAFYPRSLLEKDHLIEINYKTKRPKGHFAIYFATIEKKITKNQKKWFKENNKKINLAPITRGGGNRAVPITSIGEEEFIGYEYKI
jgi:hypothetical protein